MRPCCHVGQNRQKPANLFLGCTSLALRSSSGGDCGLAYRVARAGVVGQDQLVFFWAFPNMTWMVGPAADPRIQNRRPEVDSSPVHVEVACCHWTVLGFDSAAVSD
jgi:hypothetical protein